MPAYAGGVVFSFENISLRFGGIVNPRPFYYSHFARMSLAAQSYRNNNSIARLIELPHANRQSIKIYKEV